MEGRFYNTISGKVARDSRLFSKNVNDLSGLQYQFFVNLLFGENERSKDFSNTNLKNSILVRKTMYEQHACTYDYETPYKFNAKELDPETQRVRRTPLKNKHKVRQTGNYYYGARYAVYPAKSGMPKTSIWLSIDPLAEKYPNFSPYTYVANNPVMFVDPDGRSIKPTQIFHMIPGFTPSSFWYWYTYPNFEYKNHGKVFNATKDNMLKQSSIFKYVYSQLEKSKTQYTFKENNIIRVGVKGAMNKQNIDANGYFESTTNTIYLNYDSDKHINGYKNKGTIFEEVFHAGQYEYYKGNMPSGIDIEVEAKIAKSIEGFGDFTYEGFDNFVTNLKSGNLSEAQIDKFNEEVNKYAQNVSASYIKYKMQNGYTNGQAEQVYGMGSFTGFFPYLETILDRSLLNNELIINSNK